MSVVLIEGAPSVWVHVVFWPLSHIISIETHIHSKCTPKVIATTVLLKLILKILCRGGTYKMGIVVKLLFPFWILCAIVLMQDDRFLSVNIWDARTTELLKPVRTGNWLRIFCLLSVWVYSICLWCHLYRPHPPSSMHLPLPQQASVHHNKWWF